MFLKKRTMEYTKSYWNKINEIKNRIEDADAVLIGAGAGMSISSGFSYSGDRFYKYFDDFYKKYGIEDMYSGGFFPFETLEEYWAWWSRHIYINRYNIGIGITYSNLYSIIKNKNYFVLTTNVDYQFQKAGFDKEKLFYTQGDYGLFQCSIPCHNETYNNYHIVNKMFNEQIDCKIPSELIPYCPVCKKAMTMNLHIDSTFVRNEGWYKAKNNYENFVKKYSKSKIVFLELGVGNNTPGIIKYPFWQMTQKYKNSFYISVNMENYWCPFDISNRSICINKDINSVLTDIKFN